MKVFRWTALAMTVLAAGAWVLNAQQKFPLRPGEWAMTTEANDPHPLLFCLNDESWQKALTQNPACAIHELNVSSSGASYSMNCALKTVQMKGTVKLIFDGMEHMIGKANIETTVDGQTKNAQSQVDYRWKNSQCSPNDLNLRNSDKK